MCRCIYKSSKKTGNTIQGDALEAVFARQHKNNPNIQRMRKKFGKELEEIPDGDYVFLRRKSAKFKPIFCLFAYKAVDAICDGKPQKSEKQKVKLNFDQRLFEGFANESIKNVISDSHRFTLILIISVRVYAIVCITYYIAAFMEIWLKVGLFKTKVLS